MEDDFSNILGGNNVIIRANQPGRWSGLSFGIKSAFTLAGFLVIYVAGIRVWEALLIWRENSYKLSMRRRHGIPDNDRRPFNVAYAAAMRARQDAENAKRKARVEQVVIVDDEPTTAQEQGFRQRLGNQRNVQLSHSTGVSGVPGRFTSSSNIYASASTNASDIPRYETTTTTSDFANRYNPNSAVRISQPEIDISPPRAGPSRRSSRRNISILDDEGRKRGFDGEEHENIDHSKKTRVEGDEFIDGDEDAEWQESQQLLQRGSKRVLRDEDDSEDVLQSKRVRDKRARKISLEKNPQTGTGDMDIDDIEGEDQLTELRPSRGRKRDRAEAGSTFGGDDEDSAHEAEIEDEAKARRQRRKRRTVAKRKSDAGSSSRGKKRDRDIEDGESDAGSDDGVVLKVSRKKRGKKQVPVSVQDDELSDVSMDESQGSSNRGRSRQIGDEWESNGVKYKIGPNGQRLRQALIKKARQRFIMPQDSQHPDRQANLEVCVETWLTEEEFREAKAQLLLAWQDSPKPSAEPETPSIEPRDTSPQAHAGKNLLWKSTSTPGPSPTSYFPTQTAAPGTPQSKERHPHLQSIATNLGLRINPFYQQRATSGKRIASSARVASAFGSNGIQSGGPGSPSLTDSTNGNSRNGHKTFSKWEKQDLEAKAMMKMREANRKKEVEKAQKLQEEKEKAEKEKREREAAAAAKAIPTITLTKPTESKPAQSSSQPQAPIPALPLGINNKSAVDKASTSIFGPPSVPFTLPAMGSMPTKPAESSAKPPVLKTPQPQPSTSTTGFSFSNPGQPKPNGSLFGDNSGVKGGAVSSQQKPSSSFSFPPPTQPSNPPSAPANNGAPSFTFATQASQVTSDKTPAQASSGGPLLSRMAPLGNTPQPTPQAQQPQSSFSFSKPTASEAPKTKSVFGNLSVPQTTTTSSGPSQASVAPSTLAPSNPPATAVPPVSATSSSTQASGPKFSFGISNKPANSAPATLSSSSLSGALGSEAAKPATNVSPFGFKTPTLPTEASTSTTSGPAPAPKFSFAPTPSSSAFGATSTLGETKAPTTAPQPGAPSGGSPFSGFGNSGQSSTSVFSNNQSVQPSPFGSSGSTIFGGGATNLFGAAKTSAPASTPAAVEPPKSSFSFGNPSTPSATPSTTPATGNTSAFSFNFGTSTKDPTTPQPSQPSVFGKPAGGPSAFGFGTPNTNTVFGNPPTSTGQQQQ